MTEQKDLMIMGRSQILFSGRVKVVIMSYIILFESSKKGREFNSHLLDVEKNASSTLRGL